jgi:hypothetical protein
MTVMAIITVIYKVTRSQNKCFYILYVYTARLTFISVLFVILLQGTH